MPSMIEENVEKTENEEQEEQEEQKEQKEQKERSGHVGRPRKSSWSIEFGESKDGTLYLPIMYSVTDMVGYRIIRFFMTIDHSDGNTIERVFRKAQGQSFKEVGPNDYVSRRQYYCRLSDRVPVCVSVKANLIRGGSGRHRASLYDIDTVEVSPLRFCKYKTGNGLAFQAYAQGKLDIVIPNLDVLLANVVDNGRQAYVTFNSRSSAVVEAAPEMLDI